MEDISPNAHDQQKSKSDQVTSEGVFLVVGML